MDRENQDDSLVDRAKDAVGSLLGGGASEDTAPEDIKNLGGGESTGSNRDLGEEDTGYMDTGAGLGGYAGETGTTGFGPSEFGTGITDDAGTSG